MFGKELAETADAFGLTEMEAKEALVHKGREKEVVRKCVERMMNNDN